MTHCGCKVKIEKNLSGYMKIPEIIYCPLHLAAPELLKLVDDFNYVLDNVWAPDYKKIYAVFGPRCKELIAKANPRKEP